MGDTVHTQSFPTDTSRTVRLERLRLPHWVCLLLIWRISLGAHSQGVAFDLGSRLAHRWLSWGGMMGLHFLQIGFTVYKTDNGRKFESFLS